MKDVFKTKNGKIDWFKIAIGCLLLLAAFENVYWLNYCHVAFLVPFTFIWVFEGMNVGASQPSGPSGSEYLFVILVVLYYILAFVLLFLAYKNCYKFLNNKIAKIIFAIIGVGLIVIICTRIPAYQTALKEVFKVLK